MQGAPRAIERKVITALFCDVVGSTELGERLDPEDIERLMGSYFQLARRRVEANGGSIEKFIGDAVVGVFGAPVLHEDDPARAIRAALDIVSDIQASGLGFQVRIGIHSGLAVVRVDEDRTAEEGIATGDILNTAARLQNAASPGGIVVGEPTYLRTQDEFEWVDLGEVALKGKALPVHVWQPVRVRQATSVPAVEATEFVGRDEELARLIEAIELASADRRIELVTIVADAGMGKSRLVREVARRLQARGVTWLRGRCLPYGDGVSFWALGEIVKASAGIVDSDDDATVRAKLDAAIVEPDPEVRGWLRERLAPLAGLQSEAPPAAQETAFVAWSRYLISLGAARPLVLAIEDLHWADPALVSFITHLADQKLSAPIVVLVTARPEVAEQHPDWLTRAGQGTVVQLVSLGDQAIRQMVEATMAGASPDLLRTVLERAAGSPLYAEQLAAFVAERGMSAADETLDESAIPASVQAVLAARIDALPRDLKPVLLDASVIGRTFWSGAVASLEDLEPASVGTALDDLARRELTRHNVPSTLLGEAEYGFWHALLRDVAYSFLPRAARLAKHRAAARWITERAGGALGELAEIVADHLRRALDLGTAAGAGAGELEAIRSELADTLLAAGEHTMGIEVGRAVTHARAALELLPADDPRRPAAFDLLGRALTARDQFVDAAAAFEQGVAAHRALGNELAAAELSTTWAMILMNAGQRDVADAAVEAARPILEANPGPGLVAAHVLDAQRAARRGSIEATDAAANRALELAERLGLPRPYRALATRGLVRIHAGDATGEAYLGEAVALATAAGDNRYAVTTLSNMGASLMNARAALGSFDQAIALAARYGISDASVRALRFDTLELAGGWDEVVAEGPSMLAAARARGDRVAEFMVRMGHAGVLAGRGETPTDDVRNLTTQAVAIGFQPYIPAGVIVQVELLRGDREAARRTIEEALASVPEDDNITGGQYLVDAALVLDDLALARRVLATMPPALSDGGYGISSELAQGLILEREGDLAGAMRRFQTCADQAHEFAWIDVEGQARAGLGRCQVAIGDIEAGLASLREARRIEASLKAAPMVARIDADIAAAGGS